jgi:hypothetical protein
LGSQSQQATSWHLPLRKFILTQLLRELGCTKAQVGQTLAGALLDHLESLGWLPHGLEARVCQAGGFCAMATQFRGQHTRICLRLLGRIMALVTEQQRLISLIIRTTIGLLGHRLLFQPHQTTTGSLEVGELLLEAHSMHRSLTQQTAPTHLTQQA